MAHVDLTLAANTRSADIDIPAQGYVHLVASDVVYVYSPGVAASGDALIAETSKADQAINVLPGDTIYFLAGANVIDIRYTLPA